MKLKSCVVRQHNIDAKGTSEFLLEICCMRHMCKSTCFQSCLRTFDEIRVFERVRSTLVDILENGAGTQLLTAIALIGLTKF